MSDDHRCPGGFSGSACMDNSCEHCDPSKPIEVSIPTDLLAEFDRFIRPRGAP